MPMPSYPLRCYQKGCDKLAIYKIASRWSDGITSELKTYGLTCPECLGAWFEQSVKKQRACRLTPGEKLEPPGIYHLARGQRDQRLERIRELEEELLRGDKPTGISG